MIIPKKLSSPRIPAVLVALSLAVVVMGLRASPAPASLPPDLAAGSRDTCDSPAAGSVFGQDFETFPAGTPPIDAAMTFRRQFCPALRYAAGFGSEAAPPLDELPPDERADRIAREAAGQYNGPSDTVRITVAGDGQDANGQALRILYPKGTNTPSHSGAQFEMPIPGAASWDRDSGSITGKAHDELYLSYRVRFGKRFDWAQGGKLPGLLANDAAGFPDSANEVSARLMWRAKGRLEFYLHTDSDPRERLLWNNIPGAGHARLAKGTWHTLQFRLKLNTPGRANGIWQGWLDGKLSADYDNLRFRSSPNANLNTVYFSTFHGGSSGSASSPEEIWWPSRNGYARFDDFQASTTPIEGLQR
jgi:hypothetical protein